MRYKACDSPRGPSPVCLQVERDVQERIKQTNPVYEAYQLACDILDGKKDDTYLEDIRGYLGQALDM